MESSGLVALRDVDALVERFGCEANCSLIATWDSPIQCIYLYYLEESPSSSFLNAKKLLNSIDIAPQLSSETLSQLKRQLDLDLHLLYFYFT